MDAPQDTQDGVRLPWDRSDQGGPEARGISPKSPDLRGPRSRPVPANESDDGAADADEDNDSDAVQDSAEDQRRRKKRRWITIIIVAIVLVAGVVAGVLYWMHASQYVATDDAFIDGEIVRVAPQEAGKLVEVNVANNQHVKAGDLLVKLEPEGPQAVLALRKAQLDAAVASVSQAKAQVAQTEAQVGQAQSTLQGNLAQAQNLRSEADRLQTLFDKQGTNALSRQGLDNALAQAQQAEAQAAAAKTAVTSAQASVTAANATLEASNAQVEQAKAQVQAAQVDIDHLTIVAPIDGQVVQKNINLGSYVSAGTQMMAIVPEHLYVTANYKETQLNDIKLGAKVDISVDAFPDVDFTGTVRSIQHGAGQAFQLLPPENATGNFVKVVQRVPVRISIDSPSPLDYPIGPGMSVEPSIHVSD